VHAAHNLAGGNSGDRQILYRNADPQATGGPLTGSQEELATVGGPYLSMAANGYIRLPDQTIVRRPNMAMVHAIAAANNRAAQFPTARTTATAPGATAAGIAQLRRNVTAIDENDYVSDRDLLPRTYVEALPETTTVVTYPMARSDEPDGVDTSS
jgi:hypothetical protein